MNEAVNRFIQETGEVYAEQDDRDVSPILFKADDEPMGSVFELTLPKGEPHPYWRVREREMVPEEVAGLATMKAGDHSVFAGKQWGIGSILGSDFKVRGYVYNARVRNAWNLSVDKVH